VSRTEVIIVRDPDGRTEVTVYVDGEPVEGVEEYNVDAGSGWDWEEWKAHRDHCLTTCSDGVLTDLADAFTDPPGGEYIENCDGADWLDGFTP
jgi:hypothetical protein